MSADCECVVIGAGVIGLAVAAHLAQRGLEVVILEAESDVGSITSARNSEVIHAGIYYAANSLKARYCVRGKQLMYAYCEARAINYRRCGKLIVASDNNQVKMLSAIKDRAAINGVVDLQFLSRQQTQKLEPQVSCYGALLSPSTGIVDSHAFMLSLVGDAENHGAVLVRRTRVDRISHERRQGVFEIQTQAEGEVSCITAESVVNAAGHNACAIANQVLQLSASERLVPVMLKGNYFSLNTTAPFTRLIYPVPESGGLGVHLTLDLAGRARFGPDVEPVCDENYTVDPARATSFHAAIRRYWPALPDNALVPDYSGIRPRVSINNRLYPDFLVQGPNEHGVSGLVNLLGMESPGLTASLAVAEAVAELLALTIHK